MCGFFGGLLLGSLIDCGGRRRCRCNRRECCDCDCCRCDRRNERCGCGREEREENCFCCCRCERREQRCGCGRE